jgi:hypothetical protein
MSISDHLENIFQLFNVLKLKQELTNRTNLIKIRFFTCRSSDENDEPRLIVVAKIRVQVKLIATQ